MGLGDSFGFDVDRWLVAMAQAFRDWKVAWRSRILFVWQDLANSAHEYLDFECGLCADCQVALRMEWVAMRADPQGVSFLSPRLFPLTLSSHKLLKSWVRFIHCGEKALNFLSDSHHRTTLLL